MIIRLSQKLNKKIKAGKLEAVDVLMIMLVTVPRRSSSLRSTVPWAPEERTVGCSWRRLGTSTE